MDKLLDTNLLRALQQHVGAVDVGMRKAVGVAKAQVNVRLGGKVEDGIDIVAFQAVINLGGGGDVSLVEGEVPLVIEDASVVEGRAVVQLIE